MNLYRWTQEEWSQAVDGLAAQGVNVEALTASWGTSVNPAENEPPITGWNDDDVILNDDRHQWVLGVLASELESHHHQVTGRDGPEECSASWRQS